MSSKFFLGTVALAAGAVIYEKNRKQHQVPSDLVINRTEANGFPTSGASKIPAYSNSTEVFGGTAGANVHQGSNLTKELNKDLHQAGDHASKILQQTGEHVDNRLDEVSGKVKQDYRNVKGDFERRSSDASSSFNQNVGNIKDGIVEDVQSLKNAIFHTSQKTKEEVQDELERAKTSVHDGNKTSFGSPKTLGNNNASIFNWGENKVEEARAKLVNQYDEANKRFHELSDEFKDHADRYAGDKKSFMEQQIDDAKQRVSDLKSQLDNTAQDFNSKVKQDANKLSDKLYESELATKVRQKMNEEGGLLNPNRSKEEELAKRTAQSLHGWGDTASEFSEEQYKNVRQPKEDAKKEAKKWWNWGRSKTAEGIDIAQEKGNQGVDYVKDKINTKTN
ncbi:Mitochondrial outer membrane protein OM45 [Hanseniaspora osmophila]|uniref:Mitochondrial outer membrane protein OM45 n=1 Tax=Hanseniaspora osmophila TaxID=56408 RepID=A0A1E5RNL9_9ASCO|nr:Mitochondrial outer membrane protein OM45 [Hanseniaspora osmophila]